ncbi:SIP domain-containing protein [Amycolatopsis acidiphila]|uniref:siderophore-interacting protein n=1 Tax=Amycolatopsis acidiphila TaxID=715473 RepID=UPI0019A4704D|nr:SIP domain-containing protein [Amycolatopsis acidiphila]UIJ63341.1 SIP domain-containing protein [Amycolatopsis acidiphila]GHG75108.1 hypothetical protein GCM10017788_39640 [Amycolatopsis acidiphila]
MGTTYRPPEHAQSQLLAGDETALPAILAILDQAPSLTAEVHLEAPAAAEVRDVVAPPWTRIHWCRRTDAATSVRRHLVNDHGAPKAGISFAGYWRHGWSAPG